MMKWWSTGKIGKKIKIRKKIIQNLFLKKIQKNSKETQLKMDEKILFILNKIRQNLQLIILKNKILKKKSNF